MEVSIATFSVLLLAVGLDHLKAGYGTFLSSIFEAVDLSKHSVGKSLGMGQQ